MAPRRATVARVEADRSFERLYRGHRGHVYRVALRELGNVHDAEDVTQAAFVDAYRAVLRGSQPEAPRAWLLAIAENVRRRRFRTSMRRPLEEPLDSDTAPAAEPTTEQANALRAALAELPGQQREVFLLREIAGLSYDEIAEQLGSTVGAVQMLLFRARQALRAELEPPPVTRLQRGIAVPIPAWLTTLVARSDSLALTPRVAGLVGAAVVATTGVGVTVGHADSPPHRSSVSVAFSRDTPLPAAERRVRAVVVDATQRAVPVRAVTRKRDAVPVPPAARPTALPAPASTPSAPAEPAAPAPVAPTSNPEPEAPPPAPERPLSPLTPVTDIADALPPVEEISTPTSLTTLLEQAGAAAVAVGNGPPLPALPLDTLPPVP